MLPLLITNIVQVSSLSLLRWFPPSFFVYLFIYFSFGRLPCQWNVSISFWTRKNWIQRRFRTNNDVSMRTIHVSCSYSVEWWLLSRVLAEPIIVENGQFSWEGSEGSPMLSNINVRVKPGTLVAVVGPVGSGKSSLLSAILGEMYKQSGFVNTTVSIRGIRLFSRRTWILWIALQGSLAYVPQQAWIQNATFRDNITFGDTSNNAFYEKVVEACALNADLKILPGADQTEIGEKVKSRIIVLHYWYVISLSLS